MQGEWCEIEEEPQWIKEERDNNFFKKIDNGNAKKAWHVDGVKGYMKEENIDILF